MPVKIKSKTKGFRRAGIAHSDEWVEYPDGRFSKAELAALKAEPELTVEISPAAEDKAPKTAGKSNKS